MNGIVGVVRTNITRLQRATLEALVVLDVHARDVIKTDLLDANITSPTEFAWLAQLRYYWEENDLWVKITNSTLAYNYEYSVHVLNPNGIDWSIKYEPSTL